MITQESVAAECKKLGVEIRTWDKAGTYTNVAIWAKLFGYKDFERNYFMTLRPRIMCPVGIRDPIAETWKTIAHELVHWKRQPSNKASLLWWVVKYGACQKFRALEEMYAHLADLQTGRLGYDIPHIVEHTRQVHSLDKVDPAWMCAWLEAMHNAK